MCSEKASSKDSTISKQHFRQMLSGNSSQSHGRKMEKQTAKKTGGKPVSGSGSKRANPGDVTKGQWLIEEKTTTGKSMTVKELWLRKIKSEAASVGKIPLVKLNIGDETWYAIPDGIMEGLMQDE